MNDLIKIDLQSLSEEINKFLPDYYFYLSSGAAFTGDYVTAGNYISVLTKSFPESVTLMNLQAKIYAQQGKFTEAAYLWRKCLKIDPDNNNFIRALYRIDQLQVSQIYRHLFLVKLLGGLCLIAGFILLISFLLTAIKRQSGDLRILRNQQTLIQNKIDSMIFLETTMVSSSGILNEIETGLKNIDGISIGVRKEELTVTFNEDIFRNGDKLSKSGSDKVIQVAKTLEPFTGRIVLVIMGCSDDVPISNRKTFQNNQELRLARSVAVHKLISENSRIFPEDILTGASHEGHVPFNTENTVNKLKNRTVTIRTLPKKP